MDYRHRMCNLTQVAGFLLDQGIPPRRLLQAVDLPPSSLLNAELWVDRRVSLQVGSELVRMTGDEFCGVHVAERNRFEQFGAWGIGILNATTLREAGLFAARAVHHIQTGTRVTLDCRGRQARLTFRLEGFPEGDPRQHVEGGLLLLRRLLDLTCEHIPAEAHFAHDRPKRTGELERLFGPRLAFRADETMLVFDRAALSLPLKRLPVGVPPKSRYLPPKTPRETGGAVFRVLTSLIEYDRPTIARVAAALSMNPRTLQRHLAAWQLTFDEILDEYRRYQAMVYLAGRRHSITDIAFRLGYSDCAHFTRAFRRWTGRSPREALTGQEAARFTNSTLRTRLACAGAVAA